MILQRIFEPLLNISKQYDRSVGFFTGEALAHWGTSLYRIVQRDDYKVRLIMSVVVISDKDIALLEQYIDKKELANLKEKSAVRLSGPLVNSAPNGNYFRSLFKDFAWTASSGWRYYTGRSR